MICLNVTCVFIYRFRTWSSVSTTLSVYYDWLCFWSYDQSLEPTKFFYGPLYITFLTEKYPFSILTNGNPFSNLHPFKLLQIQCLLIFFQKKKSQNQNVLLNVFTAIKCICWPYWAFLQTEMNDFLTFSYTSTREITIAFHIPQAFKRYHFQAEPPCISHGREYPLGFRSRRCRISYRVRFFF